MPAINVRFVDGGFFYWGEILDLGLGKTAKKAGGVCRLMQATQKNLIDILSELNYPSERV
jgi:hypothetical protein